MKKLDIQVGEKFGDWTVIDTNVPSKHKSRYVKCQCKCGYISNINCSALRRGKTTCCKSCSKRKTTIVLNIGDKHKHWTVIDGPVYKKNTAYYKVKCDCGKEFYKIPIKIISTTDCFQCLDCSHKENGYKATIENGRIKDFTKSLYGKFKRSAESRNIQFLVTIEYLSNLFDQQNCCCAITGDKINKIADASLDRIDSSKGYVEGNVQWVTIQANLSKHVMTMEELYDFCRKVLNHANQQPSQGLTTLEGSETNGWNCNAEYNTDTSAEHPEMDDDIVRHSNEN